MLKRKQLKDLFSFGFKKTPPEKVSSKLTSFIRNKFILTGLYKLSFL